MLIFARRFVLLSLLLLPCARALGGGADLSQIPCACASVVDSQIPGPLAGGGGKILANLSKSGSFTKAGYDVGKFHECQHNIGGADEMQADVQGAELACKAGLLNEDAVQNLCAILMNSKSSTGKHPPGPVRCQTYKTALEKCKKGGGGGGSGGGANSCAGGQPMQPPGGAPGGSPPGSPESKPAASSPRESPDDANPFKTGNYEKEAAKLDGSPDEWAKAPDPAVPLGKSSPPISDITHTGPAGPLLSGHVDTPAFAPGRHAASAPMPGSGEARALGASGAGSLAGGGGAGKARETAGAGTEARPADYVFDGKGGGKGGNAPVKSANAEIADIFSKQAIAPGEIQLSTSEVAGALKDIVPASADTAGDTGPSLFERLRASLRRAQLSGKVR